MSTYNFVKLQNFAKKPTISSFETSNVLLGNFDTKYLILAFYINNYKKKMLSYLKSAP